MSEEGSLFLGVDMGGTNIRFSLVDIEGRVHRSESRALPRDPADRVLAPLDILSEHGEGVAAVGLAVAGTVTDGVLDWSANLGLAGVDFAGLMAPRVSGPVIVLNDARAAGLAEALVGGGSDARWVLSITVGTGIGGALILDGHLVLGTGGAGEIGHMVVDPAGPLCECRRAGCWERLVGGRALKQQAETVYPSEADPLAVLLADAERGSRRLQRSSSGPRATSPSGSTTSARSRPPRRSCSAAG